MGLSNSSIGRTHSKPDSSTKKKERKKEMSRDSQPSNLALLLKERLQRIDGAKSLIISTLDGMELMDVSALPNDKAQRSYDDVQIIHQYSPICGTASDQMGKLGLGAPQYSMVWLDEGILVQSKLESAVLSIFLDSTANLGILEEQIVIIQSILKPFTTSNFINATI